MRYGIKAICIYCAFQKNLLKIMLRICVKYFTLRTRFYFDYQITKKYSQDESIPLHYLGGATLFVPCLFDDDEESSSGLQAATQFLNSTSQALLSAFILKQACRSPAQALTHFLKLVCSAAEILEKEKIKKYMATAKHAIAENILNCFIMLPPSINRHVFLIMCALFK
jgi:hypothetical protein